VFSFTVYLEAFKHALRMVVDVGDQAEVSGPGSVDDTIGGVGYPSVRCRAVRQILTEPLVAPVAHRWYRDI
jgi:hypothetical protein